MWAWSPFITSCWGIFDQFLFVLLCFNQHSQPGTGSNAAESRLYFQWWINKCSLPIHTFALQNWRSQDLTPGLPKLQQPRAVSVK